MFYVRFRYDRDSGVSGLPHGWQHVGPFHHEELARDHLFQIRDSRLACELSIVTGVYNEGPIKTRPPVRETLGKSVFGIRKPRFKKKGRKRHLTVMPRLSRFNNAAPVQQGEYVGH